MAYSNIILRTKNKTVAIISMEFSKNTVEMSDAVRQIVDSISNIKDVNNINNVVESLISSIEWLTSSHDNTNIGGMNSATISFGDSKKNIVEDKETNTIIHLDKKFIEFKSFKYYEEEDALNVANKLKIKVIKLDQFDFNKVPFSLVDKMNKILRMSTTKSDYVMALLKTPSAVNKKANYGLIS